MTFLPRPVQSPRIPIWVACYWPNKKPLRRAARYDGVVPTTADWTKKLTPSDVKQIIAYVSEHCTAPRSCDVIISGETPSDPEESTAMVQPYVKAGATWWSENINGWRGSVKEMRQRIRLGPPTA